MTHDPEEQICAEEMSERVFEATGYRIQWEHKEMNDTVKDSQPLNDEIVAEIVMKPLRGRILQCDNLLFAYHAPSGLWKKYKEPALVIQAAIDDWSIDQKIFHGFNVKTLKDHSIDLGDTPDMSRMAAKARTKIPDDDCFLLTKQATTRRKIKFLDCVYDITTGKARYGFLPEEKFLVHVPRALPARVEADVEAARAFVQDIFTLPGVDTAPRDAEFDFKKIPLWQFVVMAIGAAVAGDVDVKLMYAMIGQRNSGKGMLMTAVEAAFGNIVDTGKSANNLLGNDNNNDEAKKYMWLAQAAINGRRLLWTNEVRTLCSRGETYIDGNLVKGIASGGDPLEVRKNNEDPYPARHEFTMFLNCNDLPPVRPSIGGTLMRVRFPNRYVESPTLPNEKQKNDDLKKTLELPSFADGMVWLILDEYREFLASGRRFQAIPEVVEETLSADEAEGEDLITALSDALEFAPAFETLDKCRESGFLMKPSDLKEIVNGLKKQGKLSGVSKSGVLSQLAFRGYPKSNKIRFDPGSGVVYTAWIMGVRERRGEDSEERPAGARGERRGEDSDDEGCD